MDPPPNERISVNSLIANLETETEIAKYSENIPKMSTNNASKNTCNNLQNIYAVKCQICDVVFSNPSILVVHVEFVHGYLEKSLFYNAKSRNDFETNKIDKGKEIKLDENFDMNKPAPNILL